MNIKELLIKICEDIIKENNKDFNHIEYEATDRGGTRAAQW